jgi:predicted Fe-Mo cluster-binding NifX family protein
MKLLLPMDEADTQDGKLVRLDAASVWAVIVVEEGEVAEVGFFEEREHAMSVWPDAVVVTGDFEPVMEFIEQQMMVLVAHAQRTVDEIVEAFLFKELHEPGF